MTAAHAALAREPPVASHHRVVAQAGKCPLPAGGRRGGVVS
jgi:hypothetical protein